MKADAIRGHLDGLILAVLAGGGPAHGYAVIKALRERSGGEFDLPEGSVYPALHRLERTGLIKSSWLEAQSRQRRVYEITSQGRGRLEQERRDWRRFVAAAEAILDPAPGSGVARG